MENGEMSVDTSMLEQLLGGKMEIVIERGPEVVSTGAALDDYIKGLNLPKEQNDTLVNLMVSHVLAAEKNGFTEGCKLGRIINEATAAE